MGFKMRTQLFGAIVATCLAGPVAAATEYVCAVKPVSPQDGQFALNYKLTVQENGSASIEGVRTNSVRVRETARKVRVNWTYDIYRFSSAIDKASGRTTVNGKADGFIGSLRWNGTCTKG